ncbi:MAG: hypothetical protein ABWW70_04145 [Thermoproteota archaeon]
MEERRECMCGEEALAEVDKAMYFLERLELMLGQILARTGEERVPGGVAYNIYTHIVEISERLACVRKCLYECAEAR